MKPSTDASGELVKQSPNAKLGLAEGEKVLKAQVRCRRNCEGFGGKGFKG